MAKKVKIPVKEDTRQNSTQYGYQGNVRNQYGYSPADVDFYDDKDIVEKKDSRQAQVTDASHEEKLYRLLFRISKKLKEEEEKAAISSSKEPELKAPQTPAASDPDPKSAASPDSKTSAESDEREAVVPISALSPGKTEAKDLEEPNNQNTASPANESRDSETAAQTSSEAAVVSNANAEHSIVEEKAAVADIEASEESESEEKADVAEEPEHAQTHPTSSTNSPAPVNNNSDHSNKAQELTAPASAQSKENGDAIEEKGALEDELPEPEKKAAGGGGSGGRIIDMADASMDGGPERVEEKNAVLDKKEKHHLDTHSKAKAAQAGTKIGGLSTNQKKKEDASTKLDKTKDAVEEKTSEKEAEVNAGQVGKVDEAETPEVNKDEAKSTLNQSLQASMPQKVEDVDNFKDHRIASKIGDKVKAAIDAKAGEVTGTFEVLDKTPEPDEPRKSVPFADIEQAPATPDINAGENLIPKVDEKSINLDSYLTESDNLLKKEGIKQEHLDLVDSGDLFEAKKIQQDIDKKAKEEPGKLRSEEKDLHGKNEAELQKKEAEEKGKMQKEREAGLGSARGSQVGTKGSLEDKKKEVTDHINKIYEDVNKQVQDKLTKLKTDSLAAFDREEAAASSAFENNVNTKMDKFKDERYSGVGGKFSKVRDWFLGIDDLPEVKQIFEEEKAIYINRIDNAISKIINDSQKVIDECKTLIANARKEIEEYVKGLSPALQKIGEEAEKEIKKKLDELDEKVNKAAEELKEALAKKRAEAIANIDKKIEKMKEEMSGFLSKMGDLLIDAALKFFKWALEAAGHSADEIMGIINKGKAVLTAVVSDPIQFLKNLAAAVGGGVKNFGANIMKHLGEGFMNWLTGQLNSLPIQLPEKFDLKGIVSLTLQVLGLTYASLRNKLSNKVGEEKVQMAETGVEMMMEVKEKGPIAMYDMMAEKADSIKNEFIEGAKEWAITNMIKQGLIRLATMINPAGAIVQAVLGIYNGIIFLVNNWDRILAFVNSVFDSIAAIASGALGQASAFIEKTMAQTIPLILDFIAQQLNLSGIAERITKIIHRIRKPIDQVIDKVIDFITNKVKKIAGKLLGKDKDKHKEKAEDTKKDFEKDKGDDKTTDVDRKEHKVIAHQIVRTMEQETKSEKPETTYKNKRALARQLEIENNAKLKNGIKTTINIEPFEKLKDGDIDFTVEIGPNTTKESGSVPVFGMDNEQDEARFSQLLMKAMEAAADQLYEGGDISKTRNDKKKSKPDLSEEGMKKEVESNQKQDEKHLEELKKESNSIHQKISAAQKMYIRACNAHLYPNNTFNVGSGSFFVESAANYYIVPLHAALTNFDYKVGKETITNIFDAEIKALRQIKSPKQRVEEQIKRKTDIITKNPENPAKVKIEAELAELRENLFDADDKHPNAERLEEWEECRRQSDDPNMKNRMLRLLQSDSELKTTEAKSNRNGAIAIQCPVANAYDYGKNPLSVEDAKSMYLNFPGSINSGMNSTLFLAGTLAEPSRYSIAHITNILLLNENTSLSDSSEVLKRVDKENKEVKNKKVDEEEKPSVFNHMSMTQGGSQFNSDKQKELGFATDGRLNEPRNASNVTSRDLASVKQNSDLVKSLKAFFNSNKEVDSKILDYFTKTIIKYLKSLK